MNITELETHVKPQAQFNLRSIVMDTEDGGKRISFLDEDFTEVKDKKGKVTETVISSAGICTLHAKKTRKARVYEITLVEHGFGMFNVTNKQHVIDLANLIGEKFEV